ncbi:MAG: glycosyltransferase family 4 protein [Phycisphaerae bacterium]
MRIRIESMLARSAVVVILFAAASGAMFARFFRRLLLLPDRSRTRAGADLLVVGTFYNTGWFESHIRPLAACGAVRRVTVVCDAPLPPVGKTRYACPPTWLVWAIGRVVARCVWVFVTAWREGSDTLIGYHIMPNALICLLTARCFGAKAVYQMTGGPIQIIGGGVGSENTLLRRQGRPSALREGLMFHIVRQFDRVIVRGRRATEALTRIGAGPRVVAIPGSVDTSRFCPNGDRRDYDLVCVGRLVDVKRYDRMLEVVAHLVRLRPSIRVAIVGDGPRRVALRRRAAKLNLDSHVVFLGRCDDVAGILRRARAFLMTSENEGLSIAMMEAMACGLPSIAPDVGDLKELVLDDETGLIIDPAAPEAAAAAIARLLDDAPRIGRLSANARRVVVDHADVARVAARWESAFQSISS